jgi:hypothetical protein
VNKRVWHPEVKDSRVIRSLNDGYYIVNLSKPDQGSGEDRFPVIYLPGVENSEDEREKRKDEEE